MSNIAMPHKVVFTDIDGTLIDIKTGEYEKKTNRLINTLKKNNIPLILSSAKTWTEQNKIRGDLGLNDPFIVENGGAIIIPKGYFPNMQMEDIPYPFKEVEEIEIGGEGETEKNRRREGVKKAIATKERVTEHMSPTMMIVIELGKHADEIRKKLVGIRKKYDIHFEGVSDVSLEKLSKIASMPLNSAKRMAKRDYSETILQIERCDLDRYMKYAHEYNLRIIHGGRFFDVTIGNDKGKAVNILRNLFKKKYCDDVLFFGIGDSANDAPMLNFVDIPILVQRQDRSWFNYKGIINKNNNNIRKVEGIGPKGWENAIYNIILNREYR
jgi:mannosyl-3-phosphoglycerate phosphatase family protein